VKSVSDLLYHLIQLEEHNICLNQEEDKYEIPNK